MRNLKRALSLVLASVMLVGMMVVGTSAASFSDVDSDHNVEAISVLQALGVMNGYDDGGFHPEAKVTRNQMAMIICSLLGLDGADFTDYRPFNDVPDWAAGAVGACYVNDIVGGRGEGIYDGDAYVTGVEAAAMMLRALGYTEMPASANWETPIIQKAAEVKLFKNAGSVSSTTFLNRDEVAQVTLNALQATVVTVEKTGGTITTPDGTVVNMGGVEYKEVAESEYNYYSEKSNGNIKLTKKVDAKAADKAGVLTGDIKTKNDEMITIGDSYTTPVSLEGTIVDLTDADKASENTYGSNVTKISDLQKLMDKKYTVTVTAYVNKDDEVEALFVTKIAGGPEDEGDKEETGKFVAGQAKDNQAITVTGTLAEKTDIDWASTTGADLSSWSTKTLVVTLGSDRYTVTFTTDEVTDDNTKVQVKSDSTQNPKAVMEAAIAAIQAQADAAAEAAAKGTTTYTAYTKIALTMTANSAITAGTATTQEFTWTTNK